ncbi:MAG: ABC transporter permease subunit [Bacillota bacterium]
MNRVAIRAIARKDIRAITANLQVWLPMLILPVVLGIILPSALVLALRFGAEQQGGDMQAILSWLERLPEGPLRAKLEGFPSLTHRLVYLTANYMLAPFFLLIPLMTASVISADSFAGEKERGTLESLLFAPVDMRSLFVGKVLAALLPAVGLSLATFLLCALSVNLLAWPLFGGIFFPHLNWAPLLLVVIPAVSLLAVLVNVFISARVQSFQAAYQMGGVVVIPVVLLVAGQVGGLVLIDTAVVLAIGLAMALLDLLLLKQVLRRLDRNLLFASQVR